MLKITEIIDSIYDIQNALCNRMTMNKIFCKKLRKHLEPLPFAPFPGNVGSRIQKEISKHAWDMWLEYQTRIINEQRLNPLEPKAREKLNRTMQDFLFAGDQEITQS